MSAHGARGNCCDSQPVGNFDNTDVDSHVG